MGNLITQSLVNLQQPLNGEPQSRTVSLAKKEISDWQTNIIFKEGLEYEFVVSFPEFEAYLKPFSWGLLTCVDYEENDSLIVKVFFKTPETGKPVILNYYFDGTGERAYLLSHESSTQGIKMECKYTEYGKWIGHPYITPHNTFANIVCYRILTNERKMIVLAKGLPRLNRDSLYYIGSYLF